MATEMFTTSFSNAVGLRTGVSALVTGYNHKLSYIQISRRTSVISTCSRQSFDQVRFGAVYRSGVCVCVCGYLTVAIVSVG